MFEPNCDSEYFVHEVGVDEVIAWFYFRDDKLSFYQKINASWVLWLKTRLFGEDRDLTDS